MSTCNLATSGGTRGVSDLVRDSLAFLLRNRGFVVPILFRPAVVCEAGRGEIGCRRSSAITSAGSGTLRTFVILHAKSKPAMATKRIAACIEYRMYSLAKSLILAACGVSVCSDGVIKEAVSVGSEPDSRNFWIARASAMPLG